MTASYDTVIRAFGNNAGIDVPAEALAQLGAGKRPKIRVRVGDYRFATTVGVMGGLALISLSKAHRRHRGFTPAKRSMWNSNWTQHHPRSLSRRSWLPPSPRQGSLRYSTNLHRRGERSTHDRSMMRRQPKPETDASQRSSPNSVSPRADIRLCRDDARLVVPMCGRRRGAEVCRVMAPHLAE